MHVFGLTIARTKALSVPLSPAARGSGGWFPIVRESYPGAWQQNVEVTLADVLTHPTVYACVSLIASDIAKMPMRLVQQDANGIWTETESPAFSPVLRKPNRYQTRIAFFKSWLISKLTRGNTYVLKQRDQRQIVTALYVLDPTRVTPLVAPDGAVYYELRRDDLASQPERARHRAGERDHSRHDEHALSPARRLRAAARLRPGGDARAEDADQLHEVLREWQPAERRPDGAGRDHADAGRRDEDALGRRPSPATTSAKWRCSATG